MLQTIEQDILGVINAPTELLLGRPLLGDGTAGTAASPNGGAGGLLIGNGGNGYSQTAVGAVGGNGGDAGLIGIGGAGGAGGINGTGGGGGHGGWLFGQGGTGGAGGAGLTGGSTVAALSGGLGGPGGNAGLLGAGGTGGAGGNGTTAGANVGYRGGGGTGGIGGWLYGNAGSAGSAGSGPVNGTVPLGIFNTTEPLVYISVNGGPQMPVLVDTGSAGLVVPIQDIGLQQLGLPRGFGISGYSGGLTYVYATFHTSVNFGNGIVTPPTDVNVVLLSFPQTLQGYFSTAGVQGVLGIGPNATGPGPSIPNSTLPDGMGQGVLIDEPHNQLTFGPNPLGAGVTVAGSPITTLGVKIGSGSINYVPAIVDSGGVYGTMPSSIIGGGLPNGTLITIYAPNGTPLYHYTTSGIDTPTPIASGLMNTGYRALHPGTGVRQLPTHRHRDDNVLSLGLVLFELVGGECRCLACHSGRDVRNMRQDVPAAGADRVAGSTQADGLGRVERADHRQRLAAPQHGRETTGRFAEKGDSGNVRGHRSGHRIAGQVDHRRAL